MARWQHFLDLFILFLKKRVDVCKGDSCSERNPGADWWCWLRDVVVILTMAGSGDVGLNNGNGEGINNNNTKLSEKIR